MLNKYFHYMSKHVSWINAAEIESNVMDIECIGGRISNMETLTHEERIWIKKRSDHEKKIINWGFTREKADEKLYKYYA